MDITPIIPFNMTGGENPEKLLASGQTEKISQSFEEIFLSKMFSGMVLSTPWKKASGSSEFQNTWSWNMLADTVAKEVAGSGQLGLAKQIAESITAAEGAHEKK